jgi:hypothetical protein
LKFSRVAAARRRPVRSTAAGGSREPHQLVTESDALSARFTPSGRRASSRSRRTRTASAASAGERVSFLRRSMAAKA